MNPQPLKSETLNHLAKLTKWLSRVVGTFLHSAFNIEMDSCHNRQELKTQLNRLASLAKYLSVRFWPKWLWVWIPLLSLKLQIWRLFRARSSLTFRQLRVQIHTEMCTWHDNKIQSNAPCRKVLTTQLNHLDSFTKWFRVCLKTKWLWAWISLLSLK